MRECSGIEISPLNQRMLETHGFVIPSNVVPGTFMQGASDNHDLIEETLDGKHTTPATTLVLHQRKPAEECKEMQCKFGN